MPISERLKKLLQEERVKFEILPHPKAYTAQEVAHSLHISGKVCAKAVIITVDGKYHMAVIPAHHKVNLQKIKDIMKSIEVKLAKEDDLRTLFPDSELGAEPAIGSLYNMPMLIAWQLAEKEEIIFNAGSHTECVKMNYKDYEKITKPIVGDISDIPL